VCGARPHLARRITTPGWNSHLPSRIAEIASSSVRTPLDSVFYCAVGNDYTLFISPSMVDRFLRAIQFVGAAWTPLPRRRQSGVEKQEIIGERPPAGLGNA